MPKASKPRPAVLDPAYGDAVPQNDDARVAAGKSRASRSGRKGEDVVAALNARARARGVARLDKVPTPTIWTPKGLRYAKQSTVDFVGLMLDGSARHVACEAKTCTSKPALQMAEVEPHQRAYLDLVLSGGGVAVLAVVFDLAAGRVAQFDWGRVRDLPKLTRADMEAHEVTGFAWLVGYVHVAPSPQLGGFGEAIDKVLQGQ